MQHQIQSTNLVIIDMQRDLFKGLTECPHEEIVLIVKKLIENCKGRIQKAIDSGQQIIVIEQDSYGPTLGELHTLYAHYPHKRIIKNCQGVLDSPLACYRQRALEILSGEITLGNDFELIGINASYCVYRCAKNIQKIGGKVTIPLGTTLNLYVSDIEKFYRFNELALYMHIIGAETLSRISGEKKYLGEYVTDYVA